MKHIGKHIREAIKASGITPESIGKTAKGHYKMSINGIMVIMPGSPSDIRSMKNAVASMKKAARS